MNSYRSGDQNWGMSNPTIIDYNHLGSSSAASQEQVNTPFWSRSVVDDQPLLQPLNTPAPPPAGPFGAWTPAISSHNTAFQQRYNTFVQDNVDDMDISDDEKHSKNKKKSESTAKPQIFSAVQPTSLKKKLETKSGAAFYQGLILYIPSFEQITNSFKGSPAMKMLYASFEFSFKVPLKIEMKQIKNNVPVTSEALVTFKDHLIAKTTNSAIVAQNEVCVKALELLSETCYTIQAKESYFPKCKLVDALMIRTLNLKKWEAVSQKYPKIQEIAKDSHIQKTFAVFLDNHTNAGSFEDVICCNLTRQDVMDIKRVVEFFHLSLLPCCMTTNLTKKNTPCVVSIHKYTSADKLLEILMESGGENDKFKIYSPDTFKDFYKLHHHYWDPALRNSGQNAAIQTKKTTLEDTEMQSAILKPYEKVIAEIFEKHKQLPKLQTQSDDSEIRRAGDDFMKDTLKIDMAHSKTVAPVERMQLLLQYMEQLQEYGSRVLATGRSEMIKIYHNAIENLRKDLDICRKDLEKEHKDKTTEKDSTKTESHQKKSKSPTRRKTPPKARSKSPGRRNSKRTASPKKRPRSRTPKRSEKRRSASPKRRSRSPRKSGRSRDFPRKTRSPLRRISPQRRPRARSPSPHRHHEDSVLETIFKDQFKRFIDLLRRFRIEIEDTPIERRGNLREKMIEYQEQLHKFYTNAMSNQRELGRYIVDIKVYQDEIDEQVQLIAGKPGPDDLPRNLTPPPWMNVRSFEPEPQYSSYGLPRTRLPEAHGAIPGPRTALFETDDRPNLYSTSYPLPPPPRFRIN